MTTEVKFENPAGICPPLGPYSHTVTVPAGSGLIFLSGQIGIDSDGQVGKTIAEQADRAFANVVALLEAHGLDVSRVVKLTVFIVAGQDGEAVRTARIRHFGDCRPASTTLYVAQLLSAEWLIEVEAVAVTNGT